MNSIRNFLSKCLQVLLKLKVYIIITNISNDAVVCLSYQQEKIEEIYLHLIEMNKEIKALKLVKTQAANKKATVKAFETTAKIAKGLSPFSDFFSYQAKAEQSASSSAIKKVGSVGVNFGAVTLSGKIETLQTQTSGFSMAIPGGGNTTPVNQLHPIYPKYDNVLGRMAVLETPKVKIGRQEDFREIEPILNFVGPLYGTEFKDRISFDASTFDYVFNPAAGIDEDATVIFAGLEIVASYSAQPHLLTNEFYNIDLTNSTLDIAGTSGKIIFNSEFVSLSCLSDLAKYKISN